MPIGLVLRLFLLGWGLSVLIPIGLIFGLRWYDQDKRLNDVQQLVEQARDQRQKLVKTQNDLRDFVAEQCRHAETRDVANVQTNLAILVLLKDVPRTPALDRFRQALVDANTLLEPPGEKDCQPGSGEKNP